MKTRMGKQIIVRHSEINEAIDEAIRRMIREEIDMGQVKSSEEREREAEERKANDKKREEYYSKARKLRYKIDNAESDGYTEEASRLRKDLKKLKAEYGIRKINESFKSQKLKDFARKHGGLKSGKWSASFMNDLYNMSDEEFENYVSVSPEEHYAKYGINGTDKTGYSNNNFQPIEFGDGTFMVKREVPRGYDDRTRAVIDKRFERWKGKQGDGTERYRFENPYIDKLVNGDSDHDFQARGSWGFDGDYKLDKNQLNPKAIRQRGASMSKNNGPRKDGENSIVRTAAEVSPRRISKDELREMVKEQVKSALMEGIYDYPDTIDAIILMAENDREAMSMYEQMARALTKKALKGVQLDVNTLANSSWMKKYQQWCFNKFRNEQPNLNRTSSPSLFRNFIADKMINQINNGEWNELRENSMSNKHFPGSEGHPDIYVKGNAQGNKYKINYGADYGYKEDSSLMKNGMPNPNAKRTEWMWIQDMVNHANELFNEYHLYDEEAYEAIEKLYGLLKQGVPESEAIDKIGDEYYQSK